MTQLSAFHNTTHLDGKALQVANEKARSQEEDVLSIFESPYSKTLTPEMALTCLQAKNPERYANTPITSIRRAFSNLKNHGLIYKTKVMIKGSYGMPVNCWKLV